MKIPSLSAGASPPQKAEELFDSIFEKIPNDVKSANPRQFTPYQVIYRNWFKTIPYAMRIVTLKDASNSKQEEDPNAGPQMYYYFPVNPESITISTPYAVQVTPTIGGVVQEHSGAVFYNITLSGTTAVLPDLDYMTGKPRDPTKETRPTAVKDDLIQAGTLGGFGASAINAVNSIASSIMGTSAKLVDGNRDRTSGYTAFHVLYKFIWLYHFSKANGAPYQLRFMNYKDNNQYDVVVQNFQLSRDKSRPHLYQYTIQMKGWQISTIKEGFKQIDPKDRLKLLGLGEEPSFKAKMFRVVNETKAVLNGAAGLLNAAAQDLAI